MFSCNGRSMPITSSDKTYSNFDLYKESDLNPISVNNKVGSLLNVNFCDSLQFDDMRVCSDFNVTLQNYFQVFFRLFSTKTLSLYHTSNIDIHFIIIEFAIGGPFRLLLTE